MTSFGCGVRYLQSPLVLWLLEASSQISTFDAVALGLGCLLGKVFGGFGGFWRVWRFWRVLERLRAGKRQL